MSGDSDLLTSSETEDEINIAILEYIMEVCTFRQGDDIGLIAHTDKKYIANRRRELNDLIQKGEELLQRTNALGNSETSLSFGAVTVTTMVWALKDQELQIRVKLNALEFLKEDKEFKKGAKITINSDEGYIADRLRKVKELIQKGRKLRKESSDSVPLLHIHVQADEIVKRLEQEKAQIEEVQNARFPVHAVLREVDEFREGVKRTNIDEEYIVNRLRKINDLILKGQNLWSVEKHDQAETTVNELLEEARLLVKKEGRKLTQRQLRNTADFDIPSLVLVDIDRLQQTLTDLIVTNLNGNEILDKIVKLKQPFERERIVKEYLAEGWSKHLDLILSHIGEYPELLEKASDYLIKTNPSLGSSGMVSYRVTCLKNKLKHNRQTANPEMMSSAGGSEPAMNYKEATPRPITDSSVPASLAALAETSIDVLSHMIEQSTPKSKSQKDDIHRAVQTLKLKRLFDEYISSIERLPADGLKEQWNVITENWPPPGDRERILQIVGPVNKLTKLYNFLKCRMELVLLFNDINQGGDGELLPGRDEDQVSFKSMIDEGEMLIRAMTDDIMNKVMSTVKVGDEEMVRNLIKEGYDLETTFGANGPILSLAVLTGNENLIEMLIRAGCDLEARDKCGVTAVFKACVAGFNSIVAMLKDAGAVMREEYLAMSIHNGHADVVETLLESGQIDLAVHGEEWLLLALREGHKDIVKLFVESGVRVLDEEILREELIETVNAGKGNESGFTLLQACALPSSWSEHEAYVEQVARHGDIDLYRLLMIWFTLPYPNLCDGLPFRNELPFASDVVYDVYTGVTERRSDEVTRVENGCPAITEIPSIQGYGNVEFLADHRKISKSCDGLIKNSVNHKQLEEDRMHLLLMRIGSSGEGTKVGLSDEFDYLFMFHYDFHLIDAEDLAHGYFKIKLTGMDALAARVNMGSKSFHDHICSTCTLSENPRLRSRQVFSKTGGAASKEWRVSYKFDYEHWLDISIDVVPVLHVDGWPSAARENTWMMTNAELKAEGYSYVAKPPSRKSEFGKKFPDSVQQKLWRISFGHLETKHLAVLDQRIKNVYITAKALRSPDICRVMFKDSEGIFVPMSKDLITSYWLKMVFMFNVSEFLDNYWSLERMVYMVYTQVAKCIFLWYMPLYWQPDINVLEGLSQNPVRCKKAARIMKQLVTSWYVRDCGVDPLEDRCVGGVYDHLPPRAARGGHKKRGSEGEEVRDRKPFAGDKSSGGGVLDGKDVGDSTCPVQPGSVWCMPGDQGSVYEDVGCDHMDSDEVSVVTIYSRTSGKTGGDSSCPVEDSNEGCDRSGVPSDQESVHEDAGSDSEDSDGVFVVIIYSRTSGYGDGQYNVYRV